MPTPPKTESTQLVPPVGEAEAFSEVRQLIIASRDRAFQAVNTALIDLYWKIGEQISHKITAVEWGE